MSKVIGNAERFIPERIEDRMLVFEDFPLVGAVEKRDVIVFLPSIISFFVGLTSPYDFLGIGLGIAFLVPGILLLAIAPSHKTFNEYIGDKRAYMKRANKQDRVYDSNRLRQGTVQGTRHLTNVERFHSGANCVELSDGRMVGMIRIPSDNIDFESSEKRERRIKAFKDFLETSVKEPVQIYSTMDSIDLTTKINSMKQRRDSSENPVNDRVKKYIDHRKEFLRRNMSALYQRNVYLIVSVDSTDVLEEEMFMGDMYYNLENLGGFGEFAQSIYLSYKQLTSDRQYREGEMKIKQMDKLNDKLDRLSNSVGKFASAGFVVNTDECAAILKEYWEGKNVSPAIRNDLIRQSPMVLEGDMND